jgi:indole-3-glycerol phosphate synthase
MTDTLFKICDVKREHVKQRKSALPEAILLRKAKMATPPRGFARALQAKKDKGEFALIAEIKKASPSKGIIREDFNPVAHAKAYAAGGATCLSVLTDEPFFQGRDEYLTQARAAVNLPVLRKDFILDPYQVLESRVLGADCILLIMSVLSERTAEELEATALGLGMDVLVEVHDINELNRALRALRSNLIGINNRDLKTLEIDLSVSEKLAKQLPPRTLAVAESGLNTNADLVRMKNAGISCSLVGTSLMQQADVQKATQMLLSA